MKLLKTMGQGKAGGLQEIVYGTYVFLTTQPESKGEVSHFVVLLDRSMIGAAVKV